MQGIIDYRAQIRQGELISEVTDARPEILAAKIIEATRLLAQQCLQGQPENATRARMRISAILRSVDLSAAAIDKLRDAITEEVKIDKWYVDHKESTKEDFGQAALDRFQRRAAREPLAEAVNMQKSAANREEIILFDEENNIHTLPQEVEDRLRLIGVLTVNGPTPPLRKNALKNQLANVIGKNVIDTTIERYDSLPLLEDIIEDPNIRRLCSSLTATGFETRYSCEGHGWMLAHLKFVADPARLEQLRYLLEESVGILNERWVLEEDHRDKKTLRHFLSPEHIDDSLSTRFDGVMADIDALGLLILARFGKEESEEKK